VAERSAESTGKYAAGIYSLAIRIPQDRTGKAGLEPLLSWSHIPFQLLAPFGSPGHSHVRQLDTGQMPEIGNTAVKRW